MRFAYPYMLLLLLPLFAWGLLTIKGKVNRAADVRYASFKLFEEYRPSLRARWYRLPLVLRFFTIALIIFALARPQVGVREEEITTRGLDIMLTLDISGSMQSRDFPPSRLDVAKKVLQEFIEGRQNDMIGLVVFASQSFTQCPLTLNYPVLVDLLRQVHVGTIQEMKTAIGLALANATARLKDSQGKSKVIILLTDGQNNIDTVDPITAANVTKKFGIKVYTVGVGSVDPRVRPENRVDAETLKKIAEITGGEFFLAEDNEALGNIYKTIDMLEKSDIKTKVYADYEDKYLYFLFPAFVLLCLEWLLKETAFRRIP
jgi:Ca-activated chloride channel family protein